MIVSMGAFAIADTLVKLSTAIISPAQVLFFLIGGALIIYATIAAIQKDKLLESRAFSPILLLRYSAEIAGMIGMVMALANVPLSVVGAITQASPMLATVGAVIFLKENVGWRRWCSIAIGFIGVLLIIQPGSVSFDSSVGWAFLAMAALAFRDLTTRLTPSGISSISLATFTMAAATPVTIAWVLLNGENLIPANTNWLLILPMAVIGAMGYFVLILSIRLTEVSVVMPFRYSRILFLLVLGVVVFDEKPGVSMLIGAALIIGSGSYMMWREHNVKKAQSTMVQ